MLEHSRYTVSVRYANGDTMLTSRECCTRPAAMAAEKATKLFALLTIACGNGGGGFEQFSGLNEDIQHDLLCLASDLAGEVLVLGELAAREESGGRHA
ncbi:MULTISPECIES: hypothetical protein [Cupriavidus]